MINKQNIGNKKTQLIKLIEKLSKNYISDKKIILNKNESNFLKDLSKEMVDYVPNIVGKIFIGKNLKNNFIESLKKEIKKNIKTEKQKGEIDELVNDDGTFIGSNIPILKLDLHPRKTTDQTVKMARSSQFPFIRVYYGESEEEKNNLIDEIDQSEWFGDKETKNAKNYNQANKILKSLGVKDNSERISRLKKFGFDKELDSNLKKQQKKGKCKKCFVKKRLTELGKNRMEKMIDEILLSKKSETKDVTKKRNENETSAIYKVLEKNLKSISKIANKEGIDKNKLINIIKKGE